MTNLVHERNTIDERVYMQAGRTKRGGVNINMKIRLKGRPPQWVLVVVVVVAVVGRLPALTSAQCFGGTRTMEKVVGMRFTEPSQPLLEVKGAAITSECASICKNKPTCIAFNVDFNNSSCVSYDMSTVGRRRSLIPMKGFNYFENVCLTGMSDYDRLCGNERIWSFERVLDSYLEGFDNKTARNVETRAECIKLCLTETDFQCRSAEYRIQEKVCNLSPEDRRTKPTFFISSPGSLVDYLENQCVKSLPDCRYGVRNDAMVVSMDALEFAIIQSDCESLCDKSRIMTCRSYSYDPAEKRCYLSGDDSVSLNMTVLPFKIGVVTGEKQCTVSQCERDQGTIIYEKITGRTVRTAREELYRLDDPLSKFTEKCAQRCREDASECPAFAVDYNRSRCFKLDRNTQGRSLDIMNSPGKSYFEKICVRAPLPPRCRGNVWHFERVPGMELRGRNDETLNLVESRRDCIEACLRSTYCRSAEYDYSQLVCRLSRSDRRTSPDAFTEAASSTVEYLENQCSPLDQGCPYRRTEGAYPVNLDDTIPGINSEEQCRQTCTTYPSFICRSLAYFATGRQCFISGDDQVSGGGSTAIQNRPGTTYYERDCLDGGTTNGTTGTTRPTLRPNTRPTRPTRPTTPTRPGGGGFSFAVDRCSFGRLTYEKITGYQLSGVSSDILHSSRSPGITAKCTELCKNSNACMAINLDYNRFECYSLESTSSDAPDNLRPSSGVAYFEGVCLRSGGCGLRWTYERIPNFELDGQDRETFNGLSKSECMERCLEERRFICRSASYEYARRVCRLSDQDRYSAPTSFQAAPNVDYMENQCAPKPRECAYGNNQRDRFLIYTTKTLSAFSDANCQRACDIETEFNCRSYSFLSSTNSQSDQCYLSSDTGTNAGNNAFQFLSGAMFAENKCTDFSTGTGGGGTTDGVLNCRFPITYDKIMGVDLRGAREEIRARDQLGITIECLKECDRRGGQCLAVTLETSPSSAQRCYSLEESAGNNAGALTTAREVSYFEKVCIPDRTCGKAWTFVRVPGFDLEVNGRVLNNVRSRQECQAECLRATAMPCRSATYHTRERTCRLMGETRRTDPEKFGFLSRDVEFMENQCAPDPPNCDYANYEGRFLPYFDRFFTNVFEARECQEYCDSERDFSCRSYNFQSFRRECSLSSDDTYTVGGENALQVERDYFFAEKGACKTVKVDCTPTDMLVTFSFGSPFEGRVYATGNAQACFEMGNRQNQLMLRVPLGTTCGTQEEGDGKFVNTVVVQQHPLIMQESDRTVRVECSFEAGDQTVSFAPGGSGSRAGGGIDINAPFRPDGVNDIISNTAPTPTVRMKIYKAGGAEASNVDLGELLTLKIEMESNSAFAIFARNLEARTDNGELMTLIDNIGCPRYPSIFPELQLEEQTKSLFGDFKAFRFPSTARVNFVATVRFCQDRCEPVSCGSGVVSYGRRRRRRSANDTLDLDMDLLEPDSEDIGPVEVSTDGTSETTYTFSLEPSEPTSRTTKRSVSTTGNAASTDSSSSSSPPSSSSSSSSTTTTTEAPEETPNDIPVALSLVVGEDTMPEGWDDRNRHHRYREETYVTDDYVCTPTSTVIAAVLSLLVLMGASVAGFVFFYRTKKRHWQKIGSCEPFPLPPQGRGGM